MKNTSKELTNTESRIIMLYILDKTKKSLSDKIYLELVTSLSDINYFDYSQLLQKLCEEGYIIEYLKEEQKLYKLSEKGQTALNLTLGMLPGLLKLRIDSEFGRYYKEIREAFSVSAEYNPTKSTIICRVTEENSDIFKMEMYLRNEEEAKRIVRKWNEKAGEIYLDILGVLMQDKEEKKVELEENLIDYNISNQETELDEECDELNDDANYENKLI